MASAIAKTMALLWAIFLVCGPDVAVMAYVIGKVTGLCTDAGVELRTLETPDCLHAFMLWVGGASLLNCHPHINFERRLFWNCMRVAGWCHSWSNLMKDVVKVCPRWPVILEQLQCLVLFWRNKTWRQFLKKVAGPGHDPDLFEHFPASMAKRHAGVKRTTHTLSQTLLESCSVLAQTLQ